MNVLTQCREKCKPSLKKIVFADSLDIRLIQAANELQKQGLAEPILIGNPFELRDLAHQTGVVMPTLAVVDPLQSHYHSQFVDTYLEKNKKANRDSAQKAMRNPLFYAAMMVHYGHADICIAGNLSTSGDVLRAALKVIGVAEQHKTVSSFFLMVSPDKKNTFLFADAGVVPDPTVEQLANIAIDAANSFAKLTGEIPRVAMLSFSTKGSSAHPAAQKIRDAFELVRSKNPELLIDGELQFDAAVVPEVAKLKCPDSPLHGNSNVLIFPSLNAGNIAYKVAQRLGHYQALGPLLEGLNKPMHDLSRGCSADDIVDIAVLASCMAQA
ncbi:phosphate acetyltransferase [Paraglaciecola arctica]|uniref:phosphate acetyltransferase n=1 Tax=Paraglaciecola arctica BSs20135 TaxID=493475 RepID=K6YZU5_9ALTE|nr:phosphate acetyltransferase [Paraglaciecola arctica]GAC22273.1 phosphate acetyltransferase [Paraglaciecola arctica BSs20135]